MSNHAEGIAIVLGPEDGDSYWQPLPSRGYVINKINPYTSPYDEFFVGMPTSVATSPCSAFVGLDPLKLPARHLMSARGQ